MRPHSLTLFIVQTVLDVRAGGNGSHPRRRCSPVVLDGREAGEARRVWRSCQTPLERMSVLQDQLADLVALGELGQRIGVGVEGEHLVHDHRETPGDAIGHLDELEV